MPVPDGAAASAAPADIFQRLYNEAVLRQQKMYDLKMQHALEKVRLHAQRLAEARPGASGLPACGARR